MCFLLKECLQCVFNDRSLPQKNENLFKDFSGPLSYLLGRVVICETGSTRIGEQTKVVGCRVKATWVK